MKRSLAVLLVALAVAMRAAAAGPITVPIYIEDNHAGSFYWLAERLDLEEPCTLLHFDAHSDASGIFDSDLIRRQLRRVASRAERTRLLERWRAQGTIQCFNWIEPLMPSPIEEVIWVPREDLAEAEAKSLSSTAGDLLDGHLEAAPRENGTLRPRFRTMGLEQLRAQFPNERPVVATIDLDYFAGLSPNEQSTAFERIFSFVAELRNLRAITFAVSRPYLKSDEEADALVQLALRASLSLLTATIEFEPWRSVANDRSTRANEYRSQKRAIPSFEITKASPALRALLLGNADRIRVHEEARWTDLLQQWTQEAPVLRVGIKNHSPSTDNVWRVPAGEESEIQLRPEPWYTPIEHVQWIVEVPRYLRCNLTASSKDEIGFAQGAPPRPRWREVRLPESGGTISLASLREFFDQETGCGAVRVRARVTSGNWIRESPTIEIRRSLGTGFRAAVMEQFCLPYLFGSGFLRSAEASGPETGWGADCANFLIYALRRQGARIPWSNPKQLRNYLEPIAQGIGIDDPIPFANDELERGIFLHLGTHVAGLMEDRPPLGVLNADDVVAHQLEGVPALVSVGELLRTREKTRFDLLRLPQGPVAIDVVIGGDVMLGRSISAQIQKGLDPFAGIRAVLDRANTRVVNLECVVSAEGTAAPRKRFHLRAPLEATGALSAAGIDVIGLANNHAADFGSIALLDSIRRLRATGRVVIGAGRNEFEAYAAGRSQTGKIGFIAVSDLDSEKPTQTTGAVIASTSDRAQLARAIETARAQSEFLIALVHWGEENSEVVTERQRELARWLIEHGVDLIAGSHPHCIQPLDFYKGRPIAYSLGNLVFDGAPTVASWNKGQLLEVGLAQKRGAPPSLRLVPIRLDERGFPQLTPPRELTQR